MSLYLPPDMNRAIVTRRMAVTLALTTTAAAMVFLFLKDMEPLGGLIAAFLALAVLAIHKARFKNTDVATVRTWVRPILVAMLVPSVLLTVTCGLRLADNQIIASKTTQLKDSSPWREDLPLKVHWNKRPSEEHEDGFIDTANVLGFNYEKVYSIEDANIRIRLGSWRDSCKWMKVEGFASPDPNPSQQGAQTGGIDICQFTTPFKDNQLTDYSIMAHETAHVLAAQPHFGNGLMAEGGGDGSPWFSEYEIKTMLDKINAFHESVRSTSSPLSSPQQISPLTLH